MAMEPVRRSVSHSSHSSSSSSREATPLASGEVPVESSASLLYSEVWAAHSNDSQESRDLFPCRLIGQKGRDVGQFTAHTTTLDLHQHSAWFRGWLNQRSTMSGGSTSLARLQPPCICDQEVLHNLMSALYKHSISLSLANIEPTLAAADAMQMSCIVTACRQFILQHVLPRFPGQVVHLAKRFVDLDATAAIHEHFLGRRFFNSTDEDALLSVLDDKEDSSAPALLKVLLERAACKLEVFRVVSKSSRAVDYLPILDFSSLQIPEASSLVRHIYFMSPAERQQPFWSALLLEAAMQLPQISPQGQEVGGHEGFPKHCPSRTFYARLDLDKLKPNPRAPNVMLPAGTLDGKQFGLLLQPDQTSGRWGLFCSQHLGSGAQYRPGEPRPAITLFIMSASHKLGMHTCVMDSSSPEDLSFSGWGISEAFGEGVLNDKAIQFTDKARPDKTYVLVGLHVRHEQR